MDKTYSELLRDPRWQKRKTEIMQRDNFTCQECGCKTKTLNVHHLHYLPNRNPWDYPDEDLTTLCEDCHNKIHNKIVPKVGTFYVIHHSDFWNDMVCYHIDYKNKLVYLFGIDCGAYANGYIYIMAYDEVCQCKQSNIIPKDILDDFDPYSLSSLYYAYADLLNERAEVYGNMLYKEKDVISFAKNAVKEIFSKNNVLCEIINEYNQQYGKIL